MLSKRLVSRLNESKSRTILSIAPMLERLPPESQRFDDPLLPYSKAIIAASSGLVSGYLLNFTAYLTLGGAGIVALERALAFATASGSVTILDGAFASAEYAAALNHGELMIDAVTLQDAGLCAAFENKGMTPILKADSGKYPDCWKLIENHLIFRDESWAVISAEQVTRGKLDFEKALRDYLTEFAR